MLKRIIEDYNKVLIFINKILDKIETEFIMEQEC